MNSGRKLRNRRLIGNEDFFLWAVKKKYLQIGFRDLKIILIYNITKILSPKMSTF